MTPREYEIGRSLARYDEERKTVLDPHHMGEIGMLIASRDNPALSGQGRETTAQRLDFLIGLLPADLQESVNRHLLVAVD